MNYVGYHETTSSRCLENVFAEIKISAYIGHGSRFTGVRTIRLIARRNRKSSAKHFSPASKKRRNCHSVSLSLSRNALADGVKLFRRRRVRIEDWFNRAESRKKFDSLHPLCWVVYESISIRAKFATSASELRIFKYHA